MPRRALQPPFAFPLLAETPHSALLRGVLLSAVALGGLLPEGASRAQTAASPSGTASPLASGPPVVARQAEVPSKQLREANEAYLKGARALEHKNFQDAEVEFAKAARLNPQNRDYAVALAVTRGHRMQELLEAAARARVLGQEQEANQLLLKAKELDPQNPTILQHFRGDGTLAAPPVFAQDLPPGAEQRNEETNSLAGAVQLAPEAGTHDFHLHAGAQDLLVQVCRTYGLRATVATPLDAGPTIRFDVDHADFAQALRAVESLTHTFGVPVQPKEILFATDSVENRARFEPLVEETLYMPGTGEKEMTDYANMARNVFNLRVVNAVSSVGALVLRGDQDTLEHVNATLADLVDGGSDVLLDLTLFEVDKSRITQVGAQLPSSVGVFPVAATAESLISANQTLISQAVANNLITLTGNAYTDALTELEFLLASGTVSSSEFTNLLGVIGHYGGLPLAGVYLGSTTTLNGSLSSSDVRLLDTMQLRVGDKQDGQFRVGTRYPIETGIYSSSVSSSVASAVAGLTINGTSVSSLLAQYTGSTAATIPQIQYEDLGLTLKATPQILRTGEVSVKLDFKIEALGSGSINTLPILNSRQLTSVITVPPGKTALLASVVNRSELRALSGLPFLSEIPGFQTYRSTEKDEDEVVVVLTPHIVRNKNFQVKSRRLLLANGDRESNP